MRRGFPCAGLAGRWRISPPPFSAFWILTALALSVSVPTLQTARAGEVEYAKEISTRLNPTGRTVTFPVPLNDHGANLGDVIIKLMADDAILVERATFLELVNPLVEEPGRQALGALPAEAGFIPLESLAHAGIDVRFDSGLQVLVLELSPEQRPAGDISLGGRRTQRASAALVAPEAFSGYLNVIAGVDQAWDNSGTRGSLFEDEPSARLELESVVRAGGVVVENRSAYDGNVDVSTCPETASCVYGHVAGLKRQSTRAIYDIPEEEVRIVVGDTDAAAVPLQRSADLLGIQIEKTARKLNPGESIVSTGSGSFRLERNASVDVLVNGAIVQRLQLRPGNYNLRDLPLSTGANDIELSITDDSGQRQTLAFKTYSDTSLLAAGKNEWAITGGIPSYLLDNERTYANSGYMGSGFFRYGISDELTGDVDLQGDRDIIMGGAGLAMGTDWGVFGVHGAASTGAAGTGAAVDLKWSLVNFSGLTNSNQESLHAAAEYRSEAFHTPGEFLSDASGILYPEFEYWLRLNASYSAPLISDVTATLSARYQFSDDRRNNPDDNVITGDRYGTDLTFSAPLSNMANASLQFGYSNELYVRNVEQSSNIDPEFRVGLRVNMRPTDSTMVTAGYDTLGQQANVSAYQAEGSGIGRWDTSIDVQSRGYQNTGSVTAAAGYYGNRAELRLSHYGDADDFDLASPSLVETRQRTSLRVGTAIAFAGDKIAIGAPVRGGAFGIVTPHESLGDAEVTVGNVDSPRARADAWGNALVPDLPAYLPSSVSVDVDNLPLGYSLGSGSFDTFAPYKAGYAFQVGSANSVSVYGTLVQEDGEPVSLLTGTARPDGAPGEPVSVFTNTEGRFGAEGLAPGRWIIEMNADNGPLLFAVDVPDGANGLVKVGTLHPTRGTLQ